ncbi:MAG TPA: RNase P subunit [Nitrososphaeraceae archaeon]
MNRRSRNIIAAERVQILQWNILRELAIDQNIAEKQAKLATKIITHSRIKTPYSLRQLFCRNCKQFIIPGKTSRIRIGGSRMKAIRITCLKCLHVYRKKIERV